MVPAPTNTSPVSVSVSDESPGVAEGAAIFVTNKAVGLTVESAVAGWQSDGDIVVAPASGKVPSKKPIRKTVCLPWVQADKIFVARILNSSPSVRIVHLVAGTGRKNTLADRLRTIYCLPE
jgi:hypothetical protein